MNKKDLTERDICTKFITAAVNQAGWDAMAQIREQVYFTKGRIIVRGKLVTRGKAKFADYVLYYKPNIPIALIEAKDNNHPVGGGMQQGLDYAATLDLPFVFSSNGDAFLFHDRTGVSSQIETELALNAFPTPEQLWGRYRTSTKEIWYYEHRVPEGQKAYSMTKPIRIEHLQPCIDWWEKREENEVAWKVGIEQVKARTYNLDFKNPHTVEEDHGDPAELLAKLDQSEAETARLRNRLKAILAAALLR
jgi:hypothetical protein